MLIKFKLKIDEVYYIGGSEVFLFFLIKDEEEVFLKKFLLGDEVVCLLLIECNLWFVVYIVCKFENMGINIEDLISIGIIGLIKVVNMFNFEKKIKLVMYVFCCIENEILMYLCCNNKIWFEVLFDELLNIDWDGNELLLFDVMGIEEDIIIKDLEVNVDWKFLLKVLY